MIVLFFILRNRAKYVRNDERRVQYEQYSTVQFSTVQRNAVRYNAVQYGTVRCGTVHYGGVML